MPKILHILTTQQDALAEKVMSTQRQQPDCEIKIVDWTCLDPDLPELLQEIFSADSVEVW